MKGRLTLLRSRRTGDYRTATLPLAPAVNAAAGEGDWEDAMITVFDSGKLLVDVSLSEIRARAHAHEA